MRKRVFKSLPRASPRNRTEIIALQRQSNSHYTREAGCATHHQTCLTPSGRIRLGPFLAQLAQAPPPGFEPGTVRLTVECSAVELWRNKIVRTRPLASHPGFAPCVTGLSLVRLPYNTILALRGNACQLLTSCTSRRARACDLASTPPAPRRTQDATRDDATYDESL
jgi:hypothetical protein